MKRLNSDIFKRMLISAANNLSNRKEEINALNVFPVPDGDTGTNMHMTFSSGVNEIMKTTSVHLGDCAKILSKNMLMGARGNSGVILSQIFKGFANGVINVQEADVNQLADAFINATKVAYKAVMRPVEGTILTVIREAADFMRVYVDNNDVDSVEEYFSMLLKQAKSALEFTPELLPVLKEVGVVDSGGAGLVCIFEGFVAALENKDIQLNSSENKQTVKEGYCVEAIIDLNDSHVNDFSEKRLINSLGRTVESVKMVHEDDKVRVHVHCQRPGEILTTFMNYGSLEKVKVENMKIEHNHILSYEKTEKTVHKKYAILFVCNGDGIEEMVRQYNVEYFIKGGQTMNPSTQDFMEVINKISADHIIILPNNSNIILAAKQAKDIIRKKDITVLETKTIPQGITACINFNPEDELKNNIECMTEAYKAVKTGEVTYAIKNTTYNGIEIKQGNYMGISHGDILSCEEDMLAVAKNLISQIVEKYEYVTLIYGDGATQQDAEMLSDYIVNELDGECEIVHGRQALYPFIIGVE